MYVFSFILYVGEVLVVQMSVQGFIHVVYWGAGVREYGGEWDEYGVCVEL